MVDTANKPDIRHHDILGARGVVDSIREAILDVEYAPNQRLVEADLSAQFGASRGAVRTALVQLETEGLVERVQNRGARVRAISPEEAIEICEVRMVVEGLCAAKAAERVTDDDVRSLRAIGRDMQRAVTTNDVLGYSDLNQLLHGTIRTVSNQTVAAGVLERLRAQNVRHQFRLALRPGRAQVSLAQHLEIINAICARDPHAAEAAVRTHLISVIEALAEVDQDAPRTLRPGPA